MTSSSTLSEVRPAITEWMPQELLPIMPPKVAHWWVEVSGAKVRWCSSSVSSESWSRMTPGCTLAVFLSGSTSTISRMYLEVSMITATLVVSPERLVPAPRGRTGAPCLWQTFVPAGGHEAFIVGHSLSFKQRNACQGSYSCGRQPTTVLRHPELRAAFVRLPVEIAVRPPIPGDGFE
jgi:hypothetical protein